MNFITMNKGGKGAQRLFAGNIGLIYPDFISREVENRIIADAKYKPYDNIKVVIISNCWHICLDLMQKGLYLYPQNRGDENKELE